MNYQATICTSMSCYGEGVHGGRMSQLILEPAPANTGIVFIRTDVTQHPNIIHATYNNVTETSLSTIVSNEHGVKVSTIEHLMAALYSFQIDNLIIKIDGSEVPIMDGSSRPFIFMLECAGTKLLDAKRKSIKVLKELEVSHGDAFITVKPDNSLEIDTSIDFASNIIGKQQMTFNSRSAFKDEIAAARSFGFVRDLKYLNSRGLALGVSLQNAVGIDEQDKALVDLRFEDEFVRHKILDSIGDFYTAGNVIGNFRCHKSGHFLNNQILRKIFADSSNYIVC